MKHLILVTAIIVCLQASYAQSNSACTGHPLFNTLANHTVKECQTKEFEALTIYQTDKTKGAVSTDKKGEYLKVTYAFQGDWNTRPSATQLYENYVVAIKKAGGEVLQNGNGGLYGKLKKGADTWWIKVYTDGSGSYWLESVKEGSMKQEIIATADEIKTNLAQDGKLSFYGIFFDNDKSALKPESAPTLTEIAKFLNANTAVTVFIVGHTDNTGDYTHNLTLSKERATAVVNELTAKYKVNKNQLIAEGVGPLSPVAGNTTEENKAKNRRVEMVRK